MEESNEKEKKSQEAIQTFQEKYDLIKKYLEKLDELFIGNNAEARIIIPYMNLNMIIRDSLTFYININSDDMQKDLNSFVLMVIENFLYKIVRNERYPSEEMMELLFEQLEKTFNYNSTRFLCDLLAEYLQNELHSKMFKLLNDKFGYILFNKKDIFIDYFTVMMKLNYSSLTENIPDYAYDALIIKFLKEKNENFNIPKEKFKDLTSLYEYLSNGFIIDAKEIKVNESKDSESTQYADKIRVNKEEEIINLQNEIEYKRYEDIANTTNVNKNKEFEEMKKNNEVLFEENLKLKKELEKIKQINSKFCEGENKTIESNYKFIEELAKINNDNSELKQDVFILKENLKKVNLDINNLKNQFGKLNRDYSNLKSDYSNFKVPDSNLRASHMNLNTKVINLQSKIDLIQSRDLWKKFVNYNLYYLDLKKEGKYDERINNIIKKVKYYKNSELYIRFLGEIKEIIENGNSIPYSYPKKYPIGMNVNYIDELLDNQPLPNINFAKK